jgi:hypothetical protein
VSGLYAVGMAGSVYVDVPEELAERLVDDGFRRAGVERGADLVNTVESATGFGADLVTILLARYQIPLFIRRLFGKGRDSERHNAKIVIEMDGRRMMVAVEYDDEPPDVMVRGMTALLEALTDDSSKS